MAKVSGTIPAAFFFMTLAFYDSRIFKIQATGKKIFGKEKLWWRKERFKWTLANRKLVSTENDFDFDEENKK